MQAIYLAGLCGLTEIGSHGLKPLEQFLTTKFSVLNPFETNPVELVIFAVIGMAVLIPIGLFTLWYYKTRNSKF
ncbi:hypothetical protein [Candidatus Lokiarchaeum ossiferum]|uniref:hypothetical protein n=1 Tax=Candidatus Lokiarchaeum ossiferum TaxID=2951803 RepID=UPI00352F2205